MLWPLAPLQCLPYLHHPAFPLLERSLENFLSLSCSEAKPPSYQMYDEVVLEMYDVSVLEKQD